MRANIQELLENYVIEPVARVGTTWVSLLVCILQDSGDIQQTVEMQLVSAVVIRERHAITITKDILRGLQRQGCFLS